MFLKYVKYIILEFTPSKFSFFTPSIPGIVSTGIIFRFCPEWEGGVGTSGRGKKVKKVYGEVEYSVKLQLLTPPFKVGSSVCSQNIFTSYRLSVSTYNYFTHLLF
jgi:hypothetical protein